MLVHFLASAQSLCSVLEQFRKIYFDLFRDKKKNVRWHSCNCSYSGRKLLLNIQMLNNQSIVLSKIHVINRRRNFNLPITPFKHLSELQRGRYQRFSNLKGVEFRQFPSLCQLQISACQIYRVATIDNNQFSMRKRRLSL